MPERDQPERILDVGLELLDRQVVDVDEVLVGKVDDVELRGSSGDGPLELTALLLGTQAYGHRIGGTIGRWIAAAGSKLAGTDEPIRVPMAQVREIATSIHLAVRVEDLERPVRPDRWLRDHLVRWIPGAHRASA